MGRIHRTSRRSNPLAIARHTHPPAHSWPPTSPLRILLLLGIARHAHAICGEQDQCQAMGTHRRTLLKDHIARTRDDPVAKQCNHILVAHALHYSPTENCPEAQAIHAHLVKTCIAADATQLLPHAPLCQTRAQHTIGALLTLHIVAVLTTGIAAEWIQAA